MFLASSALFTPCLTARRQARRSSAQLSHVLILMPHSSMSFLQTSLKRRRGRPVGREPSASSPYRRSLGDAAGFHCPFMVKPVEASLAENSKHALHVDMIQDLWVGNFVLPLGVQNALQAPQVEAVQFPLLACVGGPCLAAVDEYTEHAGLVDAHFGLHSEPLVNYYLYRIAIMHALCIINSHKLTVQGHLGIKPVTTTASTLAKGSPVCPNYLPL